MGMSWGITFSDLLCEMCSGHVAMREEKRIENSPAQVLSILPERKEIAAAGKEQRKKEVAIGPGKTNMDDSRPLEQVGKEVEGEERIYKARASERVGEAREIEVRKEKNALPPEWEWIWLENLWTNKS